jgi:hypothetical protein
MNHLIEYIINTIAGLSFSFIIVSSVVFLQTYSLIAVLTFQIGSVGVFIWSILKEYYLK